MAVHKESTGKWFDCSMFDLATGLASIDYSMIGAGSGVASGAAVDIVGLPSLVVDARWELPMT
jgi:hypothetical protein